MGLDALIRKQRASELSESESAIMKNIALEIIVDDLDHTLAVWARGEALGCVSTACTALTGYPFVPAFAQIGIFVALASMVWFYPVLAGLFVGVVALGYVFFRLTRRARGEAPSDSMIPSQARVNE
ncbi:hypothetical protein [Trinickia terrae]|uniref:hypothetical protein n=1 Tax=Trinickia terrae TaxID=2571161 RepID=UPI001F108D91|nr:hypothetical protein [Trinickia terrae]